MSLWGAVEESEDAEAGVEDVYMYAAVQHSPAIIQPPRLRLRRKGRDQEREEAHKSVNWVDQFWEKAQVVADWSADAEKIVKEAKSDAPGQAVGGRTGPRIGGN